MEAAGRHRGGATAVRRSAPSAASDANGHRSTAGHGRGGTAAARLIIRARLGLDEGRGEVETGLGAWPSLGLTVMVMAMLFTCWCC